MAAAIVSNSHQLNLLVFAAIGACAGVYWFVKGFRLLRRKRLILNTPTSKVQSAAMGLVEISGQAASPYVMLSPLKRAECYYYRSIAWQLKQQGKNREWVKVAEEVLHVPFYVDDGTGKVLIDPRGAEMDLHCDMQQEFHRSVLFGGPEMPGCVAEFLTRHAVDPDKHIKVEEYCIKPKNFLFILGTLSQNPGLDASVTPAWAQRMNNGHGQVGPSKLEEVRTVTQVVRLSEPELALPTTAMTQQQKIAAALSKAGMANTVAWNTTGVAVEAAKPEPVNSGVAVETRETQNDSHDADVFDLHPSVVLMKGNHQPEFFISWRSQRELVQSLGWKSDLMIWGGPALTLVSVYFVLARFGWL